MTNDNLIALILAATMGALAAMFATEYLCQQARKVTRIFKKN